jgi:ketosteroid isomerase-like protein
MAGHLAGRPLNDRIQTIQRARRSGSRLPSLTTGARGWSALGVSNDEEIAPNAGFLHQAQANMEIITYVREGAITERWIRGSAPLREEQFMNNDNVAAVRNAYAVAERKDLEGWINVFTPDGVFVDNSMGVTYRGRALADVVRNYGTAFSNMHRELYRIYVDGNVVVVQLALQGTHDGALQFPFGELPATGKQMDAPCCDVFELEDGKIKRFDCYPEGSIILAQLGVLNNLDAALNH